MVLLESIEISLGTEMPDFELKAPHGKIFKSDCLYAEKGLLVVFTCNHCPYANAVWPRLIKLARYARDLGINTVAINPNLHPDYPEDAPEKMLEKMVKLGIEFPYLVDETQQIAKAFKAQCTPDIYLFNKEHKLVYHGRIDNNWQDESKVTKEELKEAIVNLVNNKPISQKQYPSMGCSIKWR
ncbi:MAG: peroxiredoxin [Planctomycetes bacterium RIFCSPHIGHO2_12_39_6]|nr:MAG: peroxiredoxin [Planctomycetes bacterium RIFCSPHIGHO2_12_39_6]